MIAVKKNILEFYITKLPVHVSNIVQYFDPFKILKHYTNLLYYKMNFKVLLFYSKGFKTAIGQHYNNPIIYARFSFLKLWTICSMNG